MVRDLAFGLVSVFALLWMMFFAGPGTVEVATLAAAVAALIWFATTDPTRLVDQAGRPHPILFGLALLGIGLLVTAAAIFASSTTFLTLVVGMTALITGVVRAVRRGLARPMEE